MPSYICPPFRKKPPARTRRVKITEQMLGPAASDEIYARVQTRLCVVVMKRMLMLMVMMMVTTESSVSILLLIIRAVFFFSLQQPVSTVCGYSGEQTDTMIKADHL